MPIQELAFLGRWKSSVVLRYAEEALQEKPVAIPARMEAHVVDKLMAVATTPPAPAPPTQTKDTEEDQTTALEKAFAKPKDLWVVTKGRGWKSRPRHLVTKASWQLSIIVAGLSHSTPRNSISLPELRWTS